MGSNIFFNYNSNVQPGDGCLLVSEPHLPDSNFDRTVILLCKHDESGSFGFVLNRPSNVKISELIKDADGIDLSVNVGGPVEQNTLHFIHMDENLPDSEKVDDMFYWGGDFDLLLNWIKDGVIDGKNYRFFLGYSGWGAGQLDEEIKENSWIVIKPDNVKFLFQQKEDDMWKNILGELGGRFSMYSKYPVDPRLN
jgi:putative transcriptional regulator